MLLLEHPPTFISSIIHPTFIVDLMAIAIMVSFISFIGLLVVDLLFEGHFMGQLQCFISFEVVDFWHYLSFLEKPFFFVVS
jgi:hypothetical protein